MPKSFTDCISAGGRVRTKQLSGGRYLHICFPKGGGPGVAGEVHKKKKLPSRKQVRKEIRKGK